MDINLNRKHFSLVAKLTNDEFSEPQDIAAELRNIADRLDNGFENGVLRDINGNTVGEWKINN